MKNYNGIPGDYYKKVMEKGHHTRKFIYDIRENFVFSLIEAKKDEKILDIGFGSGIMLKMLTERRCNTYGVDISSEAVEFIKKTNKKAKVKVCDAQKLDFPDNSFDKVVCSEVIEHLKKPDELLKEVYRILKPKGRFIISTPNYLSHYAILEWLYDKAKMHDMEVDLGKQHISRFNYFSLKKAMKKKGFKIKNYGSFLILSILFSYISPKLAYFIYNIEKRFHNYGFGTLIFATATKWK